jgi:hypothetical protein
MNRRRILLGVAGTAMISALVGSAVAHRMRIAAGREILVATEAVDPRALFVGHFAQLRVQPNFVAADPATIEALEKADAAFVTLAPAAEPEVWRVVSISLSKPAPASADMVVVRVRPTGVEDRLGDGQRGLGFSWGVDRIYLDQQKAEGLEKAMRAQPWFDAPAETPEGEPAPTPPKVRAVLSIGTDGAALVKGVEIDGRRVETPW